MNFEGEVIGQRLVRERPYGKPATEHMESQIEIILKPGDYPTTVIFDVVGDFPIRSHVNVRLEITRPVVEEAFAR